MGNRSLELDEVTVSRLTRVFMRFYATALGGVGAAAETCVCVCVIVLRYRYNGKRSDERKFVRFYFKIYSVSCVCSLTN